MEKRVASIPFPPMLLLLVAGLSAAAAVAGADDAGVIIRLPSDTTAAASGVAENVVATVRDEERPWNAQEIRTGPEVMTLIVRGATTKGENNNGEKRPWKCCDNAVQGPMTEGKVVWYCMDKVNKCTCDRCLQLEGKHLYYCLDGYHGSKPGPSCSTRA